MRLADALVETLREWGTRYVFSVSGANVEHVHDSIHRLGDGRLESVLAKSEIGAAFMADSRARLHRTLGVCAATSGGGMMNLAVGLAESYAESVPVLALVGQAPMSLEGRGAFQDSSGVGRSVDAEKMFASMAKCVRKVDSARAFWPALEDCVRAALSGRPGPSVLLLPRDVYELEVSERPASLSFELADLGTAPEAAEEDLETLATMIRAAKRPVMLLGTGVDRCRNPSAVRRFATSVGIPVATTMGSHGSFPHDHPLFLGMVGVAGHPSAHSYLNESADLILAVGTGLDIMVRQPIAPALERCTVAAVNIDPGQLKRTVPDAWVLEADAGQVFHRLLRTAARPPVRARALQLPALTRYRPIAAPALPDQPSVIGRLRQSEAVELLEEHLPERGHLLLDAGNCAVAALHGMSLPPNLSSTIALGMGGMGYAIAAAIGAQLGDPRGRTVVVCGDGAFLMLGLEVHTAIERGLPILFVVFNNAAHGMCVNRQQLLFEGRIECSSYGGVDVSTVVRGLAGSNPKLWSAQAGTRSSLADKLRDFREHHCDGPGVLEILISSEELPPFGPFLQDEPETVLVRPRWDAKRTRPRPVERRASPEPSRRAG
jgi:acetolactate synthase-1/2/3 large subunit